MTYVVLLLHIGLCAVTDVGLVPRLQLSAAAGATSSQPPPNLADALGEVGQGATLRLRLRDGQLEEGAFQRVDADVLTLATPTTSRGEDLAAEQPLTYVPLHEVDTLWVARGHRGAMGGIIGMWLGSAAGIALSLATAANESLSAGAVFAIPITAAIGGFFGWQLGRKSVDWGKPRWTAPAHTRK